MKRSFDIVVASVGLMVLSPLFAAIAVAVKWDSPGPVFFRGVRIGLHGRPFRIFKFRSMVIDAERTGGSTTRLEDPRLTRVGRKLRRHKLDELPQLINVLDGTMSLVGSSSGGRGVHKSIHRRRAGDSVGRPGITDYASIRFVDLASEVGSRRRGRRISPPRPSRKESASPEVRERAIVGARPRHPHDHCQDVVVSSASRGIHNARAPRP